MLPKTTVLLSSLIKNVVKSPKKTTTAPVYKRFRTTTHTKRERREGEVVTLKENAAASASLVTETTTTKTTTTTEGLMFSPIWHKLNMSRQLRTVKGSRVKNTLEVADDGGPFLHFFHEWKGGDGMTKTQIRTFPEDKFRRFITVGPKSLDTKWRIGMPFQEHIDPRKITKDGTFIPISTEILNSIKEASSVKKKRVLKMKKHKHKRRMRKAKKENNKKNA